MQERECGMRSGFAVLMAVLALATGAAADPDPPIGESPTGAAVRGLPERGNPVDVAHRRDVPALEGLAYVLLACVLVAAPALLRLQRAAWDDPLDPRYSAQSLVLSTTTRPPL